MRVFLLFSFACACFGSLLSCDPSIGESPVAHETPGGSKPVAVEAKDPSSGPPSAAGVVEGRVIYAADSRRPWHYELSYVRDRATGYVAEAVVCLEGPGLAPGRVADTEHTAVVDQLDMRFVPRTTAIRAGDTVLFKNSDPRVHNIRSSSDLLPINVALSPGGELRKRLSRAGGIARAVELGCEFHPEMEGWIFVFEHRYFMMTALDGRFRLEGVPPGKYRLRMNHPGGDLSWTRDIEVEADKVLRVDIEVSPDNRSSPAR